MIYFTLIVPTATSTRPRSRGTGWKRRIAYASSRNAARTARLAPWPRGARGSSASPARKLSRRPPRRRQRHTRASPAAAARCASSKLRCRNSAAALVVAVERASVRRSIERSQLPDFSVGVADVIIGCAHETGALYAPHDRRSGDAAVIGATCRLGPHKNNKKNASPLGVEPKTSRLTAARSDQLSYREESVLQDGASPYSNAAMKTEKGTSHIPKDVAATMQAVWQFRRR